jgi:hypothetical protein
MFRLAFLAFVAASLLGAAPACAQGRPMPRGDVQRLDRILPGIASHYPGTFYDAEGPFADANGALHYRLKWMTPEGRIIWLDTDARTGRVFSVQQTYPRRDPYYGAPPPGYAPPPGEYPPPGFRGYPSRGYYGGRRGSGHWSGHRGSGHHGG